MSTEAGNTNSKYLDQGYLGRIDYFQCLADDHGISFRTVANMAKMLGPDQEFTGLVQALKDIKDEN